MISRREGQWLEASTLLAPLFSTCSRRQYFAVVLGTDGRVAGVGYNGAPSGMTHCVDGGCPRGRSAVPHGSSYSSGDGFCVAQHAEAGALLHSDPVRRRGGTLIVNGPPCFECARLIASSGVARVVHLVDGEYGGWEDVFGFLFAAGVDVVSVDKTRAGEVLRKKDIVKRLRDVTEMSWDGDEVTNPLCAEAADEISVLRTALALAVGEMSTSGEYSYVGPDVLMNRFLDEARRG